MSSEDFDRWIAVRDQEIPFSKEIDVLHLSRGVLKNCLYYPEQGEWPLFQGDARYSLQQVVYWRLSVDKDQWPL